MTLTIQPAGVAYTLYEYDIAGNLIEEVDPLGNSIYRTYDVLGRVDSETKNGLTTKYTFETGGLVSSIMEPTGAITSRSFTTNGLLKSEIDSEGTNSSYIYDFFGRLIQQTKNGLIENICYDDAKHQVIRSQEDIAEIQEFNLRGNLIKSCNPVGHIWQSTYDGLNRLTSETSPNGETTTWNYSGNTIICTLPNKEKINERYEAGTLVERRTVDARGKVLSLSTFESDPEKGLHTQTQGDIVTTTWTNTFGLPIHIQQGKTISTHHYDACGNCTSSMDGEGRTTTRVFDALGRLIQKTLPDGAIVNYSYDAGSNLISCEMPGNLCWSATYDMMGRKTSEEQKVNEKSEMHWDYTYENGLLKYAKDPLKRIHTYNYDIRFRLISEQVDKYERIYQYDRRGLLISFTESGEDISKINRVYDESQRLIEETIFLNGNLLQETHQAWSPTKRSLHIGDHQRDYHYQNGRLTSIATNGIALSYNYHLNGSLHTKTTPFAISSFQYNDGGLPKAVETKFQVSSKEKPYQESLEWDLSGKLFYRKSSFLKTSVESYSYTPRGFLRNAGFYNYTFDFGKIGRGVRTESPEVVVLEEGVDPFGKIVDEMNGNNKISTVYDPMGQVITRGDEHFQWDPWGRLQSITTDRYSWKASYDGLGRRLQTVYTSIGQESIVTTSLYDPQEEFLEIGLTINSKTFWKLNGPTSCDAVLDGKSAAILLQDGIGNLTAVASKEPTLWNEDYPSPYGPYLPQKDEINLLSLAKSFTWQSKRLDPTGLVWLGARYYDPKRGRFISSDPIGHPICLDLYGYANGDPINYHDLDGRFASPAYQSIRETVISTVNHPRVQGTMQAIGGLGEAFVGGSITAGSYGTAGLVGMPVMAHGLDHFFTGAKAVYYGTPQDTVTSTALQKAGLSSHTANLVDSGLSIAGSVGCAAKIATNPLWYSSSSIQRLSTTQTSQKALQIQQTSDIGCLTRFDLDALSKAGQLMDRGGLTKAGRALEKHGNRQGSCFPKATGNPISKNSQGQFLLDDILTYPGGEIIKDGHIGYEVYAPNGRGAYFHKDGSFRGFVEYHLR